MTRLIFDVPARVLRVARALGEKATVSDIASDFAPAALRTLRYHRGESWPQLERERALAFLLHMGWALGVDGASDLHPRAANTNLPGGKSSSRRRPKGVPRRRRLKML